MASNSNSTTDHWRC